MTPMTDKSRPTTETFDAVDVASDDSFPCSDPPSWTPVSGVGAAHD